MNILDIILALPILWLAYKGFSKGLIIEISTLAALILGIYASLHFSYVAADFLRSNFNMTDKYLNIVSFVITFLLVVIAVNLVGRLVSKFLGLIALSFVNRSLGGVFGILKAAVFLSFVLFFVQKFDSSGNLLSAETKQQSMLYPYVEPIAPQLIDWFSDIDFDNIKQELTSP